MTVNYTHDSIRLTGRWDTNSIYSATTTAPGSYFEFSFKGKMAQMNFETETNKYPFPHLWISVDGGPMVEVGLDAYLKVQCEDGSVHTCKVVYKGGPEVYSRWYAPLHGKISLRSITTEIPVTIDNDNRKTIEFIGDSITEGVLIDVDYDTKPHHDLDQLNRCFQDDVCATYAWLTAKELNLRPIFFAYGAVGCTKSGQGSVPAAPKSYPFNFDGSPITHESTDYILINHGANDRPKGAAEYIKQYEKLLNVVRVRNPKSKIFALSAFVGAFYRELEELITRYNAEHNDDIIFIDSHTWISPEPLHPLRDGHTEVARNLVPILKQYMQD